MHGDLKSIDVVLLRDAIIARSKSKAVLRKWRVGAALLGESGSIYSGANDETLGTYDDRICAEEVALDKVPKGEKIVKAAIIGDKGYERFSCYGCIDELRTYRSDTGLELIMADPSISRIQTLELNELTPEKIAAIKAGRDDSFREGYGRTLDEDTRALDLTFMLTYLKSTNPSTPERRIA